MSLLRQRYDIRINMIKCRNGRKANEQTRKNLFKLNKILFPVDHMLSTQLQVRILRTGETLYLFNILFIVLVDSFLCRFMKKKHQEQ